MGPKKCKAEAEKAPKKGKVKGALHEASIAAAKAKAERESAFLKAVGFRKKKADSLTEENDELGEEEGNEESDGEESFTSTESQHFAKQDSDNYELLVFENKSEQDASAHCNDKSW